MVLILRLPWLTKLIPASCGDASTPSCRPDAPPSPSTRPRPGVAGPPFFWEQPAELQGRKDEDAAAAAVLGCPVPVEHEACLSL